MDHGGVPCAGKKGVLTDGAPEWCSFEDFSNDLKSFAYVNECIQSISYGMSFNVFKSYVFYAKKLV